MIRTARSASRRLMPAAIHHWLRARWHGGEYVPPVGRVRFGSFRRAAPFSRAWGTERGLPIDRYYIERFLAEHAADIHGYVLEVGDDRYTSRFGGARVVQSDVLHVEDTRHATIVADLTAGDSLPTNRFDCVICTQTLPFIYDVRAAIRTLYRILKPGGVLLGSVAGVGHPISRFDMDRWGDYWRFTTLSTRLLLEEAFPAAGVTVKAYGNPLAATAFMMGLAAEDLTGNELDYCNPDYEVAIVLRALKPRPGP
jgi:SAM-dependent methyltransferase